MKIKTCVIAPYAAMVPLLQECIDQFPDLDIHIEVGDLEAGVKHAKQAEKAGYQVIISRGGTAKMIRKEVLIPVIEVHLSGYDLLRSFMLVKDFEGKKAIVGFSNVTIGAQSIIDLLELSMTAYTVEAAEEVGPLILKLKKEGYEIILGDVITIEASKQYGVEGILIHSGREAILAAFESARLEYGFNRGTHDLLRLLRQVFIEKEMNIYIINRNGDVIFEEWTSFDANPLKKEDETILINELFANVGPITKIIHQGNNQLEITGTVMSENGHEVIVLSIHKRTKEVSDNSWLCIKDNDNLEKIIHHSEAMNNLMESLQNRNLGKLPIFFIGDKGTGKSFIAQHYHTAYVNEGYFLSVDCRRVDVDYLKEYITNDIKTLYLHSIHVKDETVFEEIAQIIRLCNERGVLLIMSSEAMHTDDLPHNFLSNVHVIYIPTLLERKEDISELVTHFIAYYNQTLATNPVRIQKEALKVLEGHHWQGNVTELKGFVKSIALNEKGYVIEKEVIGKLLSSKASHSDIRYSFTNGTLKEIEKQIILVMMEEEQQNQTKVAKRLGINRATLWRKLKE